MSLLPRSQKTKMRERFPSSEAGARDVVSDSSKFENADDEYTTQQRRVIDAQLAEARKGPYHGPFDTADEAIGFLNKEFEARSGKRKKLPSKRLG